MLDVEQLGEAMAGNKYEERRENFSHRQFTYWEL